MSGRLPMHDLTPDSEYWIFWGGKGRAGAIAHLHGQGYKNLGVFAPSGRRESLRQEADALRDLSLPVTWIEKDDLGTLTPDRECALISIGFPFIFPKSFLDRFFVCLNLHPTLLPKYRGGFSGFYVIANGEEETGSTLHVLDEGIDTGPVVHQAKVSLSEFDTVRSMQKKVYALEPKVLHEGLRKMLSPDFVPIPQGDGTTYSKIRRPEDSEVDPSKTLNELYNAIRACDPKDYPAFFYRNGAKIYVTLSRRPAQESPDAEI